LRGVNFFGFWGGGGGGGGGMERCVRDPDLQRQRACAKVHFGTSSSSTILGVYFMLALGNTPEPDTAAPVRKTQGRTPREGGMIEKSENLGQPICFLEAVMPFWILWRGRRAQEQFIKCKSPFTPKSVNKH